MNRGKKSGLILAVAVILLLFAACASTRHKNRKWRKNFNDCNCSRVEKQMFLSGSNTFVYG
ncbi:MAG: hypothetical protein JXA03_07350 [Bacteroidales bacterium]|nr:hypothetical protein [Bacteroidales bacterium]